MIGLVGRNKRRYGGYIVHLGIVLIFLGFAGEGLSRDEQLLLKPGEQATVGDYTLRLDALRVTDDGQKQMITGHISVLDAAGKELGKMYPAKWFFRKHEDQPTTEVAIRRSFAEDLYIVMPGFEMQEQTASVEVHINPLVNWIWVGFGILAIGTAIALLPESAFSFAMAKLPAEAATATLLLLALLLSPALAFAQHTEGPPTGGLVLRSPAEVSATSKLACWCGTLGPGGCPKLPVSSCACGHCAMVRKEVTTLLASGKSEDQILQHFIAQQGGMHVLSEPPNEGLGRLSWLVPYAIGTTGLIVAGLVAVRWSRRAAIGAGRSGQSGPGEDAALAARLDDELRDLD
jgi:cytochrome c-type biogenesis protein CcmF